LIRFINDLLTFVVELTQWSQSYRVPFQHSSGRDLALALEVHRHSSNSRRESWCVGIRSQQPICRSAQTVRSASSLIPVLCTGNWVQWSHRCRRRGCWNETTMDLNDNALV